MIHLIKKILKLLITVNQAKRIRIYRNRIFNYGTKYECPICSSHIKKLNPTGLQVPVLKNNSVVGAGYRLNAECPVCFSIDRNRLLYLYLTNKTNLFSDTLKVLHVAPELCLIPLFESHSNIDYLSADLVSKSAKIKMDITAINYPDNSFDVVICNHVLEHVDEDRKAMKELYRVLKPGGWGILQTPISLTLEKTIEDSSITEPDERLKAFGQPDHVKLYSLDYLTRLEESGFKVNPFKWKDDNKDFGGPNNKYGLIEDEFIVLVSK